jgi:hypothetical protein
VHSNLNLPCRIVQHRGIIALHTKKFEFAKKGGERPDRAGVVVLARDAHLQAGLDDLVLGVLILGEIRILGPVAMVKSTQPTVGSR